MIPPALLNQNSGVRVRITDLPEPIDIPLAEFLHTGFPNRISMVAGLLQRRPSSLQLSAAWFGLLNRAAELGLSRTDMHKLAGEAIALQPESKFADSLFEILLDDRQKRHREANEPVFLVISCEKYLAKAMPLHKRLSEHHSKTFLVVGDPSVGEATIDGCKLIVPASDAYEGLPTKIIESLVFARREWKGAGVFKIDDDAKVIAAPNWAAISELARSTDYAGYVIDRPQDLCMDRCWHIGKCRDRDMTPYRGRYRGSYARGGSYYLGPNAIDVLARDYFRYRDEFDIELFEDKAIGSILAQNGFEPRSADVAALLGVRIEWGERS
jgi:hypothetical protein